MIGRDAADQAGDLGGELRGLDHLPSRDRTHMLFVCDGFPFPLTSGRIRQYHLLQGLARRYRVSLVAAVPPNQPPEHAGALAGITDRTDTIPTQRLASGVLRKASSRLFRRGTREIERHVRRLHEQDPFAVVLNARLPLSFRSLAPGVPVVTDLCDAVPDGLRSRIRMAPPMDAPLLIAKHRDALRAEAQMATEADHLVFASARDESLVAARRRSLPPVTVIPNGVDATYWRRRSSTLGQGTVVFAGAMPYAPNEDAALHLIGEIMPIVWEARPHARLVIAGRDPSPRLLSAAAVDARIEVTGYVEDLRQQLERASVVAAPLRFATGIQNKILEAMAMATPVVTTPVGEAGLLIPGELAPPIAVATDPTGLAALIVGKLDAAARSPSPDIAARDWVMRRFQWQTMVERLEALLQHVRTVSSPGAPPR